MEKKLPPAELAEKFRLIADFTHSWEYWIGADSKLCYVSPSCKDHTGYTQQDFLSNEQLYSDIVHPDDKPLFSRHINQEQQTPEVESLEFRIIDRNGRTRWIAHKCRPVYDQDGRFMGRRASNWDVTDQKEAEKQRDESERKRNETSAFLNTVIDAIPDVLGVQDLEHTIIRYNKAGYAFLGMDPSDVKGKKCFEIIGNKIPCHICATSEVYKSKKAAQVEKYVPEIDKWLDVRAYPIFDEAGNLFQIIEHLRDISREKAAELNLKEANERLITILNSIEAHIYVADIESYEILFMNKKMIEDFKTDYIGQKCYESFRKENSPCDICTNKLLFDKAGRPNDGHSWQGINPVTGRWYINHDRAINWVDNRMARIQIAMDITESKKYEEERQKMEKQLLQVQKLEAIGTLAGGIAHDFNNLLMGIQGRASLMSMKMDPGHPFREHVDAIIKCAQSATDLTSQLLGIARGGKYETLPVSINDVVADSSAMFGRTKKEIRIHTKLHDSSPVVIADQRQIEQVLLNIYINAWQAMPTGGELYLETSVVLMEASDCATFSIEPGRYVKITITDTGMGMDEETRQRVFDPFFTTKQMGRGTGLGLASAYGIIQNHAGAISVYSEKGSGTTFNIYLPHTTHTAEKGDSVENEIIKGTGTILLVDDESLIIEVGQEMLEVLGYDVVSAKSGAEAIEILRKASERVDLVILDMIMPDMDGSTTFDQLREIDASIPVLLSSGYSLNGQANAIMKKGCNGFIQKPFMLMDLSEKIRQIRAEAKRAH